MIFLAGWGAVVLMIHQEWGDEVRLLPTFVAIAAIALHGTWVVDDAGIVWAYARNVAAGNGLVAYAGGPIGEGFSDPLWFLLLAAAERFGLRADIAAKTLGLIFGVLAVVLSARLVREQDGPVPVMVAMALATSASWALWAASGLETALCGLLMVVTTLRARAGGVWSSAVAAMLVTWTRPEGFLLAAAALGAGRAPGRTYGAPVMAFLGLLGIRVASLGLWWPLPAFVKLGLTTSALVGGWHYLLPSLVPVGALLLLASGTTAPEDRRRLLLDLLPLWAVLGFALISGGDWMRHGRYLAPALPYVYATCVPVLWRGLRNASPTPRTLRSALLMGIVLLPQAAESLGTRGAPPLPMVVQARQGEVLARAALSACGARRPMVATADVGGVLWSRPDAQVVDLAGLTEPALVGRVPGAYWSQRLRHEPVHAVYLHGQWAERTGLTDESLRHAGYARVCRRGELDSAPTLWLHRRCNLGLVGEELAYVAAWCANGARAPITPARAPVTVPD